MGLQIDAEFAGAFCRSSDDKASCIGDALELFNGLAVCCFGTLL